MFNHISSFEKLMEAKQDALSHLIKIQKLSATLKKELQDYEASLTLKEASLHALRRSARDKTLDNVLGDLGLPGGIATAVKGIAIGYDKVEFGSEEADGSLHQLQDQLAETNNLEKEIQKLKGEMERLKTAIARVEEKEEKEEEQRRESRRMRMM